MNTKGPQEEKPENNENTAKKVGKKLCCTKKQIQDISKKLNDYKNRKISCITLTLIFTVVIAGGVGIFYNCCEKKYITSKQNPQNNYNNSEEQTPPESLQQNNKSNIYNQCIDNIKADFTLKNKILDSSFNLSTKGQQNLNIRSDCFWFIIFLIIALLLITLFYLIAFSSRESKLLQFITDWDEQEKEIKKIDIEKKCKEIELQIEKEKSKNRANKKENL